MLPWGAVEAIAKVVVLILEGVPVEQRRASALVWFHMWYPLAKLFLSKEQEKQVEAILAKLGAPEPIPNAAPK